MGFVNGKGGARLALARPRDIEDCDEPWVRNHHRGSRMQARRRRRRGERRTEESTAVRRGAFVSPSTLRWKDFITGLRFNVTVRTKA